MTKASRIREGRAGDLYRLRPEYRSPYSLPHICMMLGRVPAGHYAKRFDMLEVLDVKRQQKYVESFEVLWKMYDLVSENE